MNSFEVTWQLLYLDEVLQAALPVLVVDKVGIALDHLLSVVIWNRTWEAVAQNIYLSTK